MKTKKDSFILKIISTKTYNRLKKKNQLLGENNNDLVIQFIKRRIIILGIIVLISLFINYGFLIGPLVVLGMYFALEYFFFDIPIKNRKQQLDYEALFFFEALVLTLDSGVPLENALELTSNNIDSQLAKEFRKSLAEIKVGKTLNESLNNLKKRIPSENINTVILNITQSNKFGTNIINSIYDQVEYLREKRYLEIKARISKLPIKLSIISVIFYIPLIMILILGPILLNLFFS